MREHGVGVQFFASLGTGAVQLWELTCQRCDQPFRIHPECFRGHRYCGERCRRAARQCSLRRARRKHRRSPEGKLDHRDRERHRRRSPRETRVGDHSSKNLQSASQLLSDTEGSSHAERMLQSSTPRAAELRLLSDSGVREPCDATVGTVSASMAHSDGDVEWAPRRVCMVCGRGHGRLVRAMGRYRRTDPQQPP